MEQNLVTISSIFENFLSISPPLRKAIKVSTGEPRHTTMEDIEQLTETFVNIPSPTGEEAAFASYVKQLVESHGWHVVQQKISGQDGRFNLLITTRPLDDYSCIKLVLNSHLDVVPPHIPASSDVNNIYGRGSNETKGQIAVILSVVHRLKTTKPDLADQIAILLVVGEEIDHIGMQEANKFIDYGLKPDYLVVGEPTELKFGSVQKGALKVKLTVKGVAGHSGYPNSGRSAVHQLIPVLNDLMTYAWPKDDKLGDTTFNIGLINGGQAQNAWAEEATANIFFRVTTSVADILDKVESVVGERASVELLSSNEPVVLLLDEDPLGLGKTQVAFNTDIAYYGRLKELKGRYLFGAGSITNAFSNDEFVAKKDLHEYRRLLQELIEKLLIE